MEIVKPKVELWEQGHDLDSIWKHIERCTRVCYQSERKDDSETSEEWVKRIILKHEDMEDNHGSVLEHGTIYLTVPDYKKELVSYISNNKYSSLYYNYPFYYITTNMRVILENGQEKLLDYIQPPTKYHFKRITFSFTTDIGVTREFNRHRVNSISEESTRYCNYGKKGMKFAKLPWVSEQDYNQIGNTQFDFSMSELWVIDNPVTIYFNALEIAEASYNRLIELGWKPQQAREVLPLNTKSQLVHTAYIKDWKHFLNMRYYGISGAPHPCAKELAEEVYNIINNR